MMKSLPRPLAFPLPVALALATIMLGSPAPAVRIQETAPKTFGTIEEFRLRSDCVSRFWGRDMFLEAGVVVPPDHDPEQPTPICYSVHGFGGSHRMAWFAGPQLRKKMEAGDYPRMIYVFLNAQMSLGHHEFADSVNTGPWGEALITELIPALEAKYGGPSSAKGRFVTGHSSGGWSSLWIQITCPDHFGGAWSTAPDSVDFRDFTGINVYEFDNAYVDPEGRAIPLMRRDGEWVTLLEEYVRKEEKSRDHGGQFQSFDAVFSPRGEDGRPMPMFDRETGKIDHFVTETWRKYDITQVLRSRWKELGPKLAGKLHIYIGSQDTFRLEGAVRLIAKELGQLGSDAEIIIVEGRDHGSLRRPHETYWPNGMMEHIHRQMWERAKATAGR